MIGLAIVALLAVGVSLGIGIGLGWTESSESPTTADESETVQAMLRVARAAFDAERAMHAEAARHADADGSVVSLEESWHS
jgi:hypothetical protein